MLRVLGEVVVDGTDPIRSRPQRVVLAGLALHAGQTVPADRLAELIWPSDPPENPTASLQSHISRLRRSLPDNVRLDSSGSGYVLHSDIDAPILDDALTTLSRAEPEDRLAGIDEALLLWRGEPFTELDDPEAAAEGIRLTGVYEALLELRSETLLALGLTGEAIAALDAQRRRAPLRERPVELLMRALVASGRTADALRVYQDLRGALVEELGIDPSPTLRDLETAILTEALVAAPRDASPAPTPRRTDRQIPLPASSFFGREAVVADVVDLLDRRRIVTILGPGGIGKTRLALHVASAAAADHPDGVTVVELAGTDLAELIPEVIASRLALPPRSGVTTEDRIIDALGPQTHLLVVDNCEHLIDEVATLVDRLVRSAPEVTVLATSREPLNVDGEQAFRLEPLSPAGGAIDLFVDRAMSVQPDFLLDEITAAKVEELCVALDGLPLALELAAAKLSTASLESVIHGLDERFTLLDRGLRTADERHRSLRSVIDWSARDLEGNPRAVFIAASVFIGSFSADDAAAVCAMPRRDVAAALERLAEQSLLHATQPAGSPTRYAYLATIRAYAAELLVESPDAADTADRHALWAVNLATTMRSSLGTPGEHAAVRRLLESLPDLRVAHRCLIESQEAEPSLTMNAALYQLALFIMNAELFDWMTESADAFGHIATAHAEEVLAGASVGAWRAGDLDLAGDFAERAVLAAQHDSPGAGRAAAEATADVLGFTGELAAAAEAYDRALDLAREGGDPVQITYNLANMAMAAGYTGRPERVVEVADEARELLATDGSSLLDAWLDYAEGEGLAESDPDRAIELLGRAVDRARVAESSFIANVAGLSRAGLQIRSGYAAEAVDGLADVLEDWWRVGARVQQRIALRTVVEALIGIGDLRTAALVLGAVEGAAARGEVSGPDADRLSAARASIQSGLIGAQEAFATGTTLDEDDLVQLALKHLRARR